MNTQLLKNRTRLLFDILCCYLRAAGVFLTTGKTKDKYCIKTAYLTRKQYNHFDDRSNADQFQDSTYASFETFAHERRLTRILEIGAGSGYKLMKYFGNCLTTGTELEPALSHLKQEYPGRTWLLSDFSQVPEGTFDLVVCADVIEHLLDPGALMDYIARIDTRYVAISTPERDRLPRTRPRFGPPVNVHHIREWNQHEFIQYVAGYFDVIESRVVDKCSQYVICERVRSAATTEAARQRVGTAVK